MKAPFLPFITIIVLSGCVQHQPVQVASALPLGPPRTACTCIAAIPPDRVIFFGWGSYTLTPPSIRTILTMAKIGKAYPRNGLNIYGYTDLSGGYIHTSGASGYNVNLSVKRAIAVETQLIADGVSKSRIVLHPYGETYDLTQTGADVPKNENRRFLIMLK